MKKLVCVASSAARCPGRGHQASVTSLTPVLSEGFHWEQGSHIAPQGTVEVTGALSPAGTNPVLIPEPVSQDCVPPLHFVSVRAGRARGQAASVFCTQYWRGQWRLVLRAVTPVCAVALSSKGKSVHGG